MILYLEWQVEYSGNTVDPSSQPTRKKTPPPPPVRRSRWVCPKILIFITYYLVFSLGRNLQMIQNKLPTSNSTDEDLMNHCYVETTTGSYINIFIKIALHLHFLAPHLTRRSLPSYNEVLQKRLSSNTNPRILPYTNTGCFLFCCLVTLFIVKMILDNPEQVSKV